MKINFEQYAGFQPQQIRAYNAALDPNCKYILYGGAAGGGKSYFLRWIAVGLLIYYFQKFGVKNITLGLFCEDYPSLHDRQLSKIKFEFPESLGQFNQQVREFRLRECYGGGVIAFRNLDDTSKYLSAEFAAVLIDELTRNDRSVFDFLTGMRMRWSGIPETKFIGASNPGSIGHAWVKKLWIDKDFTGEEFDSGKFIYIPAKYSDNKYLDASYEEQLNSLPSELRRAYKDGDWNIFAGQAFDEFREAVHVIKPFDDIHLMPRHWTGIDYGYAAPFCGLLMSHDLDKNVYVHRELYEQKLVAQQQAAKVKLMTAPFEVYANYADPSMWIKNQSVQGHKGWTMKSIADQYAEVGVQLTPAVRDRLSRKAILHEFLYWTKDEKSKLYIFDNCVNLIRTLPALPLDEKNLEDVDTNAEDHAYDALTYGLLSYFETVLTVKEEKPEHTEPQFAGYEQRSPDTRQYWLRRGRRRGTFSRPRR
jgi:phage terminase large subunit